MKLVGSPPAGEPALSYVNSPTGTIVGSLIPLVSRIISVAGPPGPPGPSGTAGFTYTQSTPAATWTITNTLGRYPRSVTIWVGGEEIDADVDTPDTTLVVITFPSPTSGRAEII